jgi:hypothetical protein
MTYMPPASPVNLDASITSLSAGSLTTVARADHIHTLSNLGGGAIIASTTLGTAASNITFNSIPQIYNHLKIITSIKSASTATFGLYTYMHLRFNNDSSSSYPNSELGTTTSVYTYGYGAVLQNSSSTTTSNFNAAEIIIYNYSSTTNQKWCMSRSSSNAPTTSANYNLIDLTRTFLWLNTSAITTILLTDLSSGANFVAGSKATLYGFN